MLGIAIPGVGNRHIGTSLARLGLADSLPHWISRAWNIYISKRREFFNLAINCVPLETSSVHIGWSY